MFSTLNKDLHLVVSIQTNCTWNTSLPLNWEVIFYPIKEFFLIEPCWFFIRGGKWHKPNLCTVQIRTLGAPGIRPNTRRVSKARRLIEPCQKMMGHTHHIVRVTWHTHHIIALSQDCSRGLHSYISAWYIGHSNASTPTKIFGPIDTLCGNLHREHR